MAYSTAYTTATTQAFLNKVQMAIVSAAIAIANEGTGVANHAARAALASKILQNPQGYAQLFAVGVAADGVTDIYEIGSGKVLAGLAKRIVPALNAVSVGAPQDIEAALPSLLQ